MNTTKFDGNMRLLIFKPEDWGLFNPIKDPETGSWKLCIDETTFDQLGSKVSLQYSTLIRCSGSLIIKNIITGNERIFNKVGSSFLVNKSTNRGSVVHHWESLDVPTDLIFLKVNSNFEEHTQYTIEVFNAETNAYDTYYSNEVPPSVSIALRNSGVYEFKDSEGKYHLTPAMYTRVTKIK